jgi:hypothetical protein
MACFFPLPSPLPALAFGCAPRTRADADVLMRNGVTHIVDCSDSKHAAALMAGRIIYEAQPVADTLSALPRWWFDTAGRRAQGIIRRPHSHLLIACARGRRRSPALTYWLLRTQGLDAAESEAAVRTARPSVSAVYFPSADVALAAAGLAQCGG